MDVVCETEGQKPVVEYICVHSTVHVKSAHSHMYRYETHPTMSLVNETQDYDYKHVNMIISM